MEIKQLRTFVTAAENLNFTQTAKMLNFAQSSVTAQMKTLEEELGTPLFERLGKRLVLTQAGSIFKIYAEKMIKLNNDAKTAIRDDTGTAGTLIIGAQESQCTYRLPPILKEFKSLHPNVKLIFKPAHSDEMARKQLNDGSLDFAFIMDVCKPADAIRIEPLIQEELILVSSPCHPLQGEERFSLAYLEKETILLTETGCSYRNIFEDSLQSLGVYPQNKIEFVSVEAIKQCAIAGLGIAFLPKMAVETELKSGLLKELPWKNKTSPIFTQMAWHKDKWMAPHLEAFIELTRGIFQQMNPAMENEMS